MKKMLLWQCCTILLRAILIAVFGAGILIALIGFGMTTIFGNLRLELPFALFALSVLLTGSILASFGIASLKRVSTKTDIMGIKQADN